jgi:hypothetical protein
MTLKNNCLKMEFFNFVCIWFCFFFLMQTLSHNQKCFILVYSNIYAGPVAQWITRLTTNQEIEGSSPSRFEIFLFGFFSFFYLIFYRSFKI